MSSNQQVQEVPNRQDNASSAAQSSSTAASAAVAPPNNNNQPQDANNNDDGGGAAPKKKKRKVITPAGKRDLLDYFTRVKWPKTGKQLTDTVLNEGELGLIVKTHDLNKGQVVTQLTNYKKSAYPVPQSEGTKTLCPGSNDTLSDLEDYDFAIPIASGTSTQTTQPTTSQPTVETSLSQPSQTTTTTVKPLRDRIPSVNDVLMEVRASHHIQQILLCSEYFQDEKSQEIFFNPELWLKYQSNSL